MNNRTLPEYDEASISLLVDRLKLSPSTFYDFETIRQSQSFWEVRTSFSPKSRNCFWHKKTSPQ